MTSPLRKLISAYLFQCIAGEISAARWLRPLNVQNRCNLCSLSPYMVHESFSLWSQVMAKFNAPVIQDNPSGWGPCAVPEKFKDMPYQPFSKGDRLGKVCFLTWNTKSFPVCLPQISLRCVFSLSGRRLDRSDLPRQEIHKWVGSCPPRCAST